MKQLPITETLTMDGQTFKVNAMSPEIQQLVEFFDDWRQQEVELTSDLNKVRAALRDLQNQLAQTLQAEIEAARVAAEEAAAREAAEAERLAAEASNVVEVAPRKRARR